MISSTLHKFNISDITKASSLSHGQSLRFFSKKTLEILKLLLIIYRISLEKTPNFSSKKLETWHYTFNTLNLFW